MFVFVCESALRCKGRMNAAAAKDRLKVHKIVTQRMGRKLIQGDKDSQPYTSEPFSLPLTIRRTYDRGVLTPSCPPLRFKLCYSTVQQKTLNFSPKRFVDLVTIFVLQLLCIKGFGLSELKNFDTQQMWLPLRVMSSLIKVFLFYIKNKIACVCSHMHLCYMIENFGLREFLLLAYRQQHINDTVTGGRVSLTYYKGP